MKQTRWFCETCRREWLDAINWTPEDGCPACRGGSESVRSVEYQSPTPGLDIPRGADNRPMNLAPLGPRPILADPQETPLPMLGGAL